ncbi:MAG: antibiotic biosynthesis monooxygenase [Nocardioidaceae bacterium]|nr:antibiotic biosynthesis monooxygenase [Nocardioidaceae bacterium]
MTDLRVVATIVATPGSEELVRNALVEMAAASRQEEGCGSYELFESSSAPGTLVTIESWTTAEALDAHMQTPHIAAALAATDGHLAEPPGIHPLSPVG